MKWIGVKDRMPEEHLKVLVIKKHEVIFMEVAEVFCDKFYDSYDNEIEDATHWMSLPEPPKD